MSEIRGFSWVEGEVLAAMPRPGGASPLEDDLQALGARGIGLLVSLTVTPLDPERLDDAGLDTLHLPVKDFTAPSQAQMHEFVAAVHARLAEGTSVGVHCTAGLGRTGTMLAAYFVSRGRTATEAMAEIRELRPGSIETASQEAAIVVFAKSYAPLLETGTP